MRAWAPMSGTARQRSCGELKVAKSAPSAYASRKRALSSQSEVRTCV